MHRLVLAFTAMARGHTATAAALLPVSPVLQLLLLPVYVLILGGEAALVDADTLVEAVLLMLPTPLAVAGGLRWLLTRVKGTQWRTQHLSTWAQRLVVPLLCLAGLAVSAWQARVVTSNVLEAVLLLPPLVVFFVVLPLIATAASGLRLPGP